MTTLYRLLSLTRQQNLMSHLPSHDRDTFKKKEDTQKNL